MTLDTRALALATQVGLDIKAILGTIGNMASLATVSKSSLVGAINELQVGYQAVLDLQTANNSIIDDASSAANKGWSAAKIIAMLDVTKQEILDGAPGAFDTLKEVATYLANNDLAVTNLINQLTGTVRYDAAQLLLDTEQQQACTNIDIGSKDVLVRDIYLIARDTNTYIDPGYVEPGYFA